MSSSTLAPAAQTTLVILLGASGWPNSPGFHESQAFVRAARGFREYMLDPRGFGLPAANLFDLFDTAFSASDQLDRFAAFLEQRSRDLKAANHIVRDVLVYFVGHGGFAGSSSDFYLLPRRANASTLRASGLAIDALAEVLEEKARRTRKYVFLDCCFAAAAFRSFQGAPDQTAIAKTLDAFHVQTRRKSFPEQDLPGKGTVLLCSSDHKTPSLLLPDESCTMFSYALLDVLKNGDSYHLSHLSLREIKELALDRLTALPGKNAPRPSLHSPDQSEGDVADIPFFPNPRAEEIRLAKEAQEARSARLAREAENARLAREAQEAEKARLAREAEAEKARLAREAQEAEEARLAREAEAEKARLAREAQEAEKVRLARATQEAEEARLAREAQGTEKPSEVLKPYNLAIARNPDRASVYDQRGIVYCSLRDYPSAFKDFDMSIRLGPLNYNASLQDIENAIEAGRTDDAIQKCQALLQGFPESLEVQRFLGEIYLAQGKLEEAQQTFEWILTNDPENATIYCARALVSERVEDFDTALNCYQQAYEFSWGDGTIRQTFNRLSARLGQPEFMFSRAGLARLYMRGNLSEAAIGEWNAVLTISPDRLDARLGLMETYWRDKQYEQVEQIATALLDEIPTCLKALLLLADVVAPNNVSRARDLFGTAQTLDPAMNMARDLFWQKRPDHNTHKLKSRYVLHHMSPG